MNYLLISDDGPGYLTIEGEGRLVGRLAIFMRLFGCNLTCRGWASIDAPWGCDTYLSWNKKNKWTFEEIFRFYEEQKFIDLFKAHKVIWKLTGGEPLLRQDPLFAFLSAFVERYQTLVSIDWETNATIMPRSYWLKNVGILFKEMSWTSSPKLSTNGDSQEKRYHPEVIRFLVEQNACFKFVITKEFFRQEIDEIFEKYINAPNIQMKPEQIWLMPCAGSAAEHAQHAPFVAELAKTYHFNFSPRLHLVLWDKAVKV